jgi:threonine/homoserine/homoserine lactone efflux protein
MSAAVDLLAFAGVMALGQFSPGPDMILLTRTALQSGARKGVEMALGIACGLAVHAMLAVAGLAVAFERLPVLWEFMRWLAAGYLLWLACGLFREWHSGAKVDSGRNASGRRPFVRGLFCNLLNPKAAVFLTAVCAPFLRGARPEWWAFAIWGIVVGQGCVLWSLWAWLLQWNPLRSRYERAAQWIDGAFGTVLLVLAVRLIAG